ncbi:MAG: PilN domain-containing protein [Methylotenera sp.]|nr:PilN domain-containing protein [Methylotenera sp.]
MIRVNLLPHRQIKREARQREFNMMAVFTAIAAAAIVFLGLAYIDNRTQAQSNRNARLDKAIVKLDAEIADIKTLKEQIALMLERKQVVESLQTNRSQSVVVLDEMSRQLPEGVYLKSIKQQGNLITVEGIADTNARVATMVRNLASSNWMESPNLVEIKSEIINTLKQNAFTLTVKLKAPSVQVEEASDKVKPKGSKPS